MTRPPREQPEAAQPVAVVVMGVSGTGKTTVAERLAEELGWAFVEGDALHPPANVAAMRRGVPLTDEDRAPWLAAVAGELRRHLAAGQPVVATCSALRRSYRDLLREGVGARLFLVHLAAGYDVLLSRIEARHGHFMPASLLHDQLATLEPLGPDEDGVVLDVGQPATEVVAAASSAVRGATRRR